MDKLLTRDEFRTAVFVRDNYKCVLCAATAADAHHIIERRLWNDGGYYLNNGVSVCSECHLKCETTEVSVEQVREAARIIKKVIPTHFYDDHIYTKWGDTVLANGQRTKGELFYDPSVQKILKIGNQLHKYTDYVKYPRTHHLPWSANVNEDDRVIDNFDHFIGREVVVTIKMDGENSTLYRDYIHARSVDGRSNFTRDWLKNYWSQIRYEIPEGWRICGENLYATHSIPYVELPSYFMGFSIWDRNNRCFSYDETKEWFTLLGVTPVPELYRGPFDETVLKGLVHQLNLNRDEGYVVRVTDSFAYGEFRHKVAKYVRPNHVQTIKHWLHGQPIKVNGLKV